MPIIDLRSDTVTRPSKAMLTYMLQAGVGDDVFGDDPTVKKLEAMIAEMAGTEAALFAPSGTQSNLIGIMAHCQRGDEYIVGQTAHTYMWEGGGAAVLGSIQPQPLDFEHNGTLSLDKVNNVIKPLDDHHPRTKLLCLENTTAGKVLPLEYLAQVQTFCATKKLAAHLDGARVFNAAVKLQVPLNSISKYFDSLSICLSKGLGSPIGSLLCGNKDFIQSARRWRKVVGGGMRQVGIIAAAGIYALEHNIDRLADDHANALYFAHELTKISEIEVDINSLQTNMFFIKINKEEEKLRTYLAEKEIILLSSKYSKNGLTRIITHLDISLADIQSVVTTIKKFYASKL